MHAWLAKTIDWCVIQLARRHVRVEADPASAEPPPVRIGEESSSCAETSLERWSLAADGSFQFPSPIRTAAVENNTVVGRFYPAGKQWQQLPSVILLHGWNANLCYQHLFPWVAARLGRAQVNTVTFELPYHMHRRPRNGPIRDFISSDVAAMLQAATQAIADTRALVHQLRREGSPAVGLWGMSLGGWLAGLALRSECHLDFAVLMTPIARIDRVISELPFCEPARRSVHCGRVDLGVLNLATEAPKLSSGRVLIVESRHDLFAPAATLEELWRAWGGPEIWRLPHGHISLLMSLPVMARTVDWVARHSR